MEGVSLISTKDEAEREASKLIKKELLKFPPSIIEEYEYTYRKSGLPFGFFRTTNGIKIMKDDIMNENLSYNSLRKKEDPETEMEYTGFMEYYLRRMACFEPMTTVSRLEVTLTLAKYDLLWD